MTKSSFPENVCRAFVRQCKKGRDSFKLADSTGVTLGAREFLMRTLVLRRLLRHHVLGKEERYVGILLPPSAGGVIVNVALSLDLRISVNLNYTLTSETLAGCIAECGITHVLTSRAFMEKMQLDLPAELVFLEDLKEKPRFADLAAGFFGAYLAPAGLLERSLQLTEIDPDDVLTVIFTSGSTGTPKGVMLTHANVASQVETINQVADLRTEDVLAGILPFFHSLGYTVTLWLVAALDVAGAYHYSPLDAQQVGRLVSKNRCTILLATPSFLRNYLVRCRKEDLSSLNLVVAGAEKLSADLCEAFDEKFGVRPVEGYGATELSPLVAVNIPPSRSNGSSENYKEGTVGRPVAGVRVRVTEVETDAEQVDGREGMLWVTGPNVMKGYLNNSEATAEVISDGWYRTGDVGTIDHDGFIKITGRVSRFAKISGEMVPHTVVEEALHDVLRSGGGETKVAVTSVPDLERGERLVVVHTPCAMRPAELCAALRRKALPNIFVPSRQSFVEVDELPLLGSGKLDLNAVREIAETRLDQYMSES